MEPASWTWCAPLRKPLRRLLIAGISGVVWLGLSAGAAAADDGRAVPRASGAVAAVMGADADDLLDDHTDDTYADDLLDNDDDTEEFLGTDDDESDEGDDVHGPPADLMVSAPDGGPTVPAADPVTDPGAGSLADPVTGPSCDPGQ